MQKSSQIAWKMIWNVREVISPYNGMTDNKLHEMKVIQRLPQYRGI